MKERSEGDLGGVSGFKNGVTIEVLGDERMNLGVVKC
jgi:hypothetical protein